MLAKDIAVKHAKMKMLHDLHIQNVADRAKRVNERAKEAVARKLRLEAAKVDKATASLKKSQIHADAKHEERTAKLEAAKRRRDSLLEAVRTTRAERQADTLARQATLSSLEDKAHAKRTKNVLATANKGRAVAKHAESVAAALKIKHQEDIAAAKVPDADQTRQLLLVEREAIHSASR